jgi:hypothetical protein
MKEVACLDCHSIIAIKGQPYIGQDLKCQSCGAELEIVHLFPIEVEWVYEDDGDYDDYDDYDDDDELEDEFEEEQIEAS